MIKDTLTPIEDRYQELPLAVVVRHEAGHAVMAHCCGGWVKRILFGRTTAGENYGRAFWAVPDLDSYLLVLSGGVLALYLHESPSRVGFQSFLDWVWSPDGYPLAVSGASDWSEILERTNQPRGYGMIDFLERAVRPYFDPAIAHLTGADDLLDGLTARLLARPPGIGPQALKRFFAGKRHSPLAEWIDRPRVVCAAYLEAHLR